MGLSEDEVSGHQRDVLWRKAYISDPRAPQSLAALQEDSNNIKDIDGKHLWELRGDLRLRFGTPVSVIYG